MAEQKILPELSNLNTPYTLPVSDPFGLNTQMGAGVPGVPTIDTQNIDVKKLGKLGSQERLQNIRQQEADLRKQELQAKQQLAEGQQKIAEVKTAGQSAIATQEAERAKKIYQSVEDFREKNPAPELVPTKDNIQSLSTLFGLIGVIGMAMGGAGKQSATASLNAMSGMMKGWQQGRADLWKREVQEFDKNMLTWKAKLDDAIKKAEAAYKILPYNRAEAESKLNEILTSMGSNLLIQQNKVQGFEPTFKNLESLAKDAEFAIKESGVDRRQQETIIANKELETMREASQEKLETMREKAATERAEDVAREKLKADVRERQLGPKEKKGTIAGTGVGQIQFRYNSVITNNIEQVRNGINQITSFDVAQMPPSLTEALTKPAGGITTGVEGYVARTFLTEREARLFQQAGAGLKMAMTNIEASGISRGASVAAQNEYGKMEPRGGDSVLSKLMFLAEVKQIAELGVNDLKTSGGTPAQVERAEALVREIKTKVFWNVSQVVELATKIKGLPDKEIERLAEQASGMQNFLTILNSARSTAQAKDAAVQKSGPKEGDVSKSKSGRDITYRNGQWEYIGEQ